MVEMSEDFFTNKEIGRYLVKRPIRETSKSFVFEASEVGGLGSGRNVALKILKPWMPRERKDQFRREVMRHEMLGEHENVTSLFSSGTVEVLYEGESLECLYAATEYVPGNDLHQEIKNGRKFSLDETLSILDDVSKALGFINEEVGEGHRDVKTKNIKLREGDSKKYVLDFGGRLRDNVGDSSDISGLGSVLDILLKNQLEGGSSRAKKDLEEVVKNSTMGEYSSIREFENALTSVRRGMSRRKFMMGGLAVVGLLSAIGGAGHFIKNRIDYENSIQKISDEIVGLDPMDGGKIDDLFGELKSRIIYQKIKKIAGEIPVGRFPYVVSKGANEWTLTGGNYWSDGFWPGMLWDSFENTRDQFLLDKAINWTKEMDFNENDKRTLNAIRFFYSYAKGYEITKDEEFLEKALEASKLIANRFNPYLGFIQMAGDVTREGSSISYIDTHALATPLLCWDFEKTGNSDLGDIISIHCENIIKNNLNLDGSTIQAVRIDPIEGSRFGVAKNGYSGVSCYSRGQARAIGGFTMAYKSLGIESLLDAAKSCADYFCENLPDDFVPFYDFDDPNLNIPKDSSSAAIGASGLNLLFEATREEKYKITSQNILRSLSTKYLIGEASRQGLLLHGCSNKNNDHHTDSTLIYADYFFLDSL